MASIIEPEEDPCTAPTANTLDAPEEEEYEPLMVEDKYLNRVTKHCKRLRAAQDDPRAGKDADLASLRAYYKETKAGLKEDLKELMTSSTADYRDTMENLEKWLFVKQFVTTREGVLHLAVKDVAVSALIKWLERQSGLQQRVSQFLNNRRAAVPPEERRSYIMGMVPLHNADPSQLTDDERQEVALRHELGEVGPVRRQRIVSTPC